MSVQRKKTELWLFWETFWCYMLWRDNLWSLEQKDRMWRCFLLLFFIAKTVCVLPIKTVDCSYKSWETQPVDILSRKKSIKRPENSNCNIWLGKRLVSPKTRTGRRSLGSLLTFWVTNRVEVYIRSLILNKTVKTFSNTCWTFFNPISYTM